MKYIHYMREGTEYRNGINYNFKSSPLIVRVALFVRYKRTAIKLRLWFDRSFRKPHVSIYAGSYKNTWSYSRERYLRLSNGFCWYTRKWSYKF